ncbi:XRE family transcriptional regulator [Alteromonas oceanisediminis]|uniref:XRE family transcriptional regulator n=1 Tax=Alteromonas oceanisediminis TaxID=2836180 RepID=UPI001BDA9530|nr:LexA family transcriptional regulator [Alteromonas oceanisediminis]MBT0585608.1 LexA family transcriptional regulator [Alteromonas oceanisediminis]
MALALFASPTICMTLAYLYHAFNISLVIFMSEDDLTAQRVKHIREKLCLSQSDFAKRIGITQGALSQLESGKSQLSLPTMVKIHEEYQTDLNWLLLGEPMPSSAPEKGRPHSKISVEMLIPLIDQEAHAGYIKQCHEPDHVSSLNVYRIPGFETGNYRMFEIEGDSMLPTIHPREIVVTEVVQDWETLENGTLCVVISEDGVVAKRLYQYKEDPDLIICKSDNTEYKTYSLALGDIKEVWAVKAKITSVLDGHHNDNSKRLESIESEIAQLKKHIIGLNTAAAGDTTPQPQPPSDKT